MVLTIEKVLKIIGHDFQHVQPGVLVAALVGLAELLEKLSYSVDVEKRPEALHQRRGNLELLGVELNQKLSERVLGMDPKVLSQA